MKQLPTEVWTMIAHHTKRPQPPPKVQANWNDDFNQQDLVSLMRVDKSMYQVVAPILYEEPIVQNIGLFFLANPKWNENETETAQSIPYHKRQLLDLVKKINIIRASSSTPLDKCYMEHPYDAYLTRVSQLHDANCDRLAREEIEGWILAESLLERLAEQSGSKLSWESAFPLISFRHLTALTFGLWDDGRWTIYDDKAFIPNEDDENRIRRRSSEHFSDSSGSSNSSDSSDPSDPSDSSDKSSSEAEIYRDISASAYVCCEEILAAFFFRTLGHQAVSLCHHAYLGLNILDEPWPSAANLYRDSGSQLHPIEGLRVIHGCPCPNSTEDSLSGVIYAGPTRIFTKHNHSTYNAHEWFISSFRRSMAAYIKRHPDRLPDDCHSDTNHRLDICVLSAIEGADAMPEEAQIRMHFEEAQTSMDQVIKKEKEESDALRGSTETRYWRETLFLRKIPLNIYIGDDIPRCPGCGLKE